MGKEARLQPMPSLEAVEGKGWNKYHQGGVLTLRLTGKTPVVVDFQRIPLLQMREQTSKDIEDANAFIAYNQFLIDNYERADIPALQITIGKLEKALQSLTVQMTDIEFVLGKLITTDEVALPEKVVPVPDEVVTGEKAEGTPVPSPKNEN